MTWELFWKLFFTDLLVAVALGIALMLFHAGRRDLEDEGKTVPAWKTTLFVRAAKVFFLTAGLAMVSLFVALLVGIWF